MFLKAAFRLLMPEKLWSRLRLRRILKRHEAVADACRGLLAGMDAFVPEPLQDLGDRPVLWQYWAQGWDQVPGTVARCAASVDEFAEGYRIIRLSDANLDEYLRLPDFIAEKRSCMTRTYFSDLLRVLLLRTYGGLWLDATVLLTAPVPHSVRDAGFFVYRRDPAEPDKTYWERTYAYYYGWHPRFRVNMLSSIMAARKDHPLLGALCDASLAWWRGHSVIPDYFFLQILFDVLLKEQMPGILPPPESDCRPHYLQQSLNDASFRLMPREEILRTIPMHKLTYKHE